VDVKAQTSGRPVDKLWLVARSGTNTSRTIMFLAPNRTFFQTLANLREATEFYVTDGAARSHRLSISIRYTPQITGVEITTTFPDYTTKPTRTAKISEEAQALRRARRSAIESKASAIEIRPTDLDSRVGWKNQHGPFAPGFKPTR